jgi:hypothetical protein
MMHNPSVRQWEANRFAQITHVAKVWHACFERKLMNNTLASRGKVRDLVCYSDAVLFQHDAAHRSDSPLRR